ncbi:membrane protein, partial [Streptomyces sp. MUSC 125]
PTAPARRPRRLLPGPAAGWSNPLLLLAAAALVAGAVLGNWFALILGWLTAYGSRRLTPAESKWAVLVLPGTAVAAGLVWLWGRNDGRWGEPILQGHMNDAVAQTWPWVVRGAAVASALYLVWRSQRRG